MSSTGTRSNLNYLDQLHKFHKQQGSNLTRFPSVDKRPLDLYRLKKAVEVRGGFINVCKGKKWAEIGRDLGYSGKIMSSLSTSLKNSYQRYLHPYEEWVKTAKPGVQQQLEAEYGGPITPSPAASPMKKVLNNGTPIRSDSPLARHSTSIDDSTDADKTMTDSTPVGTPAPAGRSGFTPVNNSGTFTPVNGTNGIKRESETGTPTRGSLSAKNTPDPKDKGSALKRQLSSESLSDQTPKPTSEEETDGGERRSKRLRKDAPPTVAGSHMTLHRPSTPRLGNNTKKSSKPGEKCEACGKGDDGPNMLLCDGCDYGYHTYCLTPPIKSIPDRDWYCNRCLVGTGEFGFEDGEVYSLKQFQQKANEFRKKHFAGKLPVDPDTGKEAEITEDDVEREFWRLVENVNETVEVEYGADIHSTTHGSGFPTMELRPQDPYSVDPWNLNILPLHSESLFRHIKSDVSGMTVPWLYVGMVFSTFCWHNEDHYTYSANYQHFGATKTWYGIPGGDADKFENAMKEAVPELFEQQPDLLFQLVTLLTPAHLMKAGVKCYAIDQRAGEFVITFPQAYHAGFNHGFNFNEAVNFAPADWEPYGQLGVERYQHFRKNPVFSHDELLITAAGRDTAIKTAVWLAPALGRIRDREISERENLRAALEDLQEELVEEDLPEDEYQCFYCKVYCYLSQVTCHCTPNISCTAHFNVLCDHGKEAGEAGKTTDLTLRLRYSDEGLNEIVRKVEEKANLPNQWVEKLKRVMSENARPPLKVLRSLLSEGEKIPYHPIPEIADLKAFVERANEWVDEAMNYITRKQQNRRKNDKVWRKGTARAAELEEREREHRKLENMNKLLRDADKLFFDCPEIEQLKERARAIRDYQVRAQKELTSGEILQTAVVEELVEMGKSFNVDLPETEHLEKVLLQLKWVDKAVASRLVFLSLDEVDKLIAAGREVNIPDNHEQLQHYMQQRAAGEAWEAKAKELMSVEPINFSQLEALSSQASTLPVSRETLTQVEQILNKQREAQRQIVNLYEQSKRENLEDRPKYKDVRDVMESLQELQSKPPGTIDLEKEQKKHEDWMRKGKKLFGKANAPLHILNLHMKYVNERNNYCFALNDRPRTPVEPSSREQSPSYGESDNRSREVFCICRQPEAGMMIECEACHEWYHGKCLKIARGKVKEDDKYTCPICDYRVKIPRDAARPKLEDLIEWESEIPGLPFIPEEQEVLHEIIQTASKFRDFVRSFTEGAPLITKEEVPTMRFYLRKIEGAEILLAHETNFFRTELHRLLPIAPNPPPLIEVSLSTRKPRPTKQQKLMAQLGITSPDELPPTLRTKPHNFKKKMPEAMGKQPMPIKPAPLKNGQPVMTTMPMHPAHLVPTTLPQHLFDQFTGAYVGHGHPGPPQFGPYILSASSLSPGGLDPPLFTPSFNSQSLSHQDSQNNSEINSMFEALTNHEEMESSSQPSQSQPGKPTGEADTSKPADELLQQQ
ncbi:PLU-1-domain-containing protein [Ascobolus immersus RN42]|uniref:PLU-1-domain-containing protein n=1 Tax=Ascobolus immersus RN42 TaxID=1160509 RepID=A0A3N4ILW4_ASCIM|nr:PLU-1-domain-containing protein [Ascobolus immersus RN42]